MKFIKAIVDYWSKYYTPDGLCTLCGQSGIIHTEGIRTPAGIEVGKANYCICPNGQSIRKLTEEKHLSKK